MFRSVLCALAMAGFTSQHVLAEEQDGIATVKPSSSRENPESERRSGPSFEYLLRVADQLERDGNTEEAARVRVEARELILKENVLARKEAELECLHDELERLRALTGDSPSVMVRLIAIRIDRSRLGDRAAEFDKLLGIESSPTKDGANDGVELADGKVQGAAVLRAASAIRTDSPLFEELKSRKAISILAEPTLITTNHRPASFTSGGQIDIPLPIKQADGKPVMRTRNTGIQMEVVPTVRAGGRIRLQVKFEQSEADHANSVDVDGLQVPSITTRGVNTEIEVQSGQTLPITRMISSRIRTRPEAGVAGRGETFRIVHVAGATEPSSTHAESALATAADDSDSETSEFIILVNPELVNLSTTNLPLQPVPIDEDLEVLRKSSVPRIAEDIHYFPATPVYRKGTRR